MGVVVADPRSVRGARILPLKYVESLGWTIIARNWTCDVGEIDLIARDDQTVVFIEVKARLGNWLRRPAGIYYDGEGP